MIVLNAHPDRRRAAFSLLELVMVMSILLVISAVAAPRFAAAQQRFHADAAAQRIAADLSYASRTARAQAAAQTITFSALTHTYVSTTRPLDVGPDEPYVVHLEHPPYQARFVSIDLGGQAILEIDGYGRFLQGGVIVVASGAAQRSIVIDAASGEVTLP